MTDKRAPKFASSAYRHLEGTDGPKDDSVLGQLIELQSDIACGIADCGEPTTTESLGEIIARLQKIIDLIEPDDDACSSPEGRH